eukprot:14313267-Alexandrium_andersonii.AAC.1
MATAEQRFLWDQLVSKWFPVPGWWVQERRNMMEAALLAIWLRQSGATPEVDVQLLPIALSHAQPP